MRGSIFKPIVGVRRAQRVCPVTVFIGVRWVDNASDVVLDFQGIVACNQSFLNELFQQLEAKRIKLNLIKIVGMESETLREMVERERSRYLQITKAI